MSVIRHSVHIVSKQLASLTIVLLVLVGLVMGAVHLLSGEIEKRQDEIASWASEQIGYPVDVGAAGIHWLGIFPKVQLKAIKISNKSQQQTLLSLDELYVGLDTFSSIQRGEPVLNDITITGLGLSLERDELGKVSLKGLEDSPSSAKQEAEQNWQDWIKILNRFHLQSVTVNYQDQLSPALSGQYQIMNAVVDHRSEHWSTIGNIRLPSSIGQQLQFQAEADVESLSKNRWDWKVKTSQLNLGQLAQDYAWKDILIEEGLADITLSGTGQDNTLNTVTAELSLSKTALMSQDNARSKPPVIIDYLTGMFDWKRQDTSWQLSGQNMQLHMNDDKWAQTGFTVNKGDDGAWSVESDYIRLSDITSLASLSLLSPELLRQQRPAGDVNEFKLHYSTDKGLSFIAFKLRDGAIESWDGYPGVTGLSADIKWNEGLAKVQFDSKELKLYADQWLEHAVEFDSVSGTLDLQKSEKTWQLRSKALRVWNDDLSLQLDGQIKQQADGEIINDIRLQLDEITVARWQDYVPKKVLGKSFYKWANNAFPAGKINDGEIEWVGPLSSFPYENKPELGHFKLNLNIQDVQLHYAEDWPDLFGVTGTISGQGYDLVIKSQQGTIANLNFDDVTTTITKLNQAHPILDLTGKLNGTTAQAALFLQESPLKQRFASALKPITMKGKSNVELALKIPLTNVDASRVEGFVSFIDSQLHHSDISETGLLNIEGQLHFDTDGVYADAIKAELMGEPVRINVQPEGKTTAISMSGMVSTDQIISFWPNSVPTTIQGKTDYQLDITVLEKEVGDFYMDYEISSDLVGIEIDIPKPFMKSLTDKKAFEASMINSDKELTYFLTYDEKINVIAAESGNGLRAAINFGEAQAKLPGNGIKVGGTLAELSIEDWLEWSALPSNQSRNNMLPGVDNIEMTIESVTGFGQEILGVTYTITKDDNGWDIQLREEKTSVGSIYWPVDFSGQASLDITLDKLALKSPQDSLNSKSESQTVLWPTMNINVASLTLDDMNLGKLTFNAIRQDQTWKINTASLTSELFTVDVPKDSGQWQQLSSKDESKVTVNVTSNKLGDLLDNFGYQKAIEAENAQLIFELSWPDHFLALSSANVTGNLSIDMGKGKLNDVAPGAAGRIFGLMSIAALPRRLSLDFSDLFSKGFTFDYIKGDFKLANGQAVTDNLMLNGASAKIEMSGLTDIINKQYDQAVKVTPNVSSTLPLAGAVAGGPVGLGVGAALFVVDKLSGKLFGKNIVNLISYNYHLTGPWDAPDMSVVKPETQ